MTSALTRQQRASLILDASMQHAPPNSVIWAGGGLVTDGWTNVLTGLGSSLRDKRLSAAFSKQSILQQPELDALFAGDWLIARACERPAKDQTRRWVEVKVDGKKGSDDDIAQELERLGAKPKLTEAITWSRLHGGALLILGINDGGDPEEAVNEKRIKGIDWINVIDRWDAVPMRWYTDTNADKYGDVETYQLATTIVGADGAMAGRHFHESRTIRVDGILTARRERLQNAGWNYGIVQRLYDAVRDFHAAIGGAAHLTTDFAQAVVKIKGLAKMMAEDKDGVVKNRLLAMDLMRSLVRMVPLDEEETLERVQTPVSGLPELLDRIRDVVCGAVDMPEKILFGKATSGLGDQGQSDLEQYDNQIEGEQERNVVPQVTRLTQLLYLADGGEPKRWHVEPCPLRNPTDTEVSENRKRDAETDSLNITSGIYSPDEARKSRFGGDGYGRDIVIEDDDEALDKKARPVPKLGPDGKPILGPDGKPVLEDPTAPVDPAAPVPGADPEAQPEPEPGQPAPVIEVTGIVLKAALEIVAAATDGTITIIAAKVLLKAALHLEDADVDAMLEGVEEERAKKEAEAKALADKLASGGGAVDPKTGEPMKPGPGTPPADKQPAPGAPPAKKENPDE